MNESLNRQGSAVGRQRTASSAGMNRRRSSSGRPGSVAGLQRQTTFARPGSVGGARPGSVGGARPGSVRGRTAEEKALGPAMTRSEMEGPDNEDEEEREGDPTSQATIEKNRNLSMWDAAPWNEQLFAIAEPGSFPSDIPKSIETISYIYAFTMVSIIVLSCVAIMEASMPKYQMEPVPVFWLAVEAICVAAFSIDIVLRLVTIPNKRDFFTDPMNAIDLLAVAPFYLLIFIADDAFSWLVWLRMLRILRLARIIRVLRTANVLGFSAILEATSKSVGEMLLFIIISGTCLLILATAFFFTERGTFDRTDWLWKRRCFKYEFHCVGGVEPSPVQSIPDAFWYIIVTMSTVGFGDVYAKTGPGQLVAAATMITGVFIMGFPTMILSGHYEAVEKLEVRMSSTWAHFLSLRKKTEKPGETLKRRMGWMLPSEKEKEAERKKLEKQTSKLKAAKKQAAADGPLGGVDDTSSVHSVDSAVSKGSERAHTPRSQPKSVTVGFFSWGGQTHELKRSGTNPHMYTYDPVFVIQRTMEGAPDLRVIWGRCNCPTMVQLTLVLDHADARNEALRVLQDIDPEGTLKCSVGGGFEISHFTPNGRNAKYIMMPSVAKDNYRNSDFSIYFMRDEDGDGESDDVDYLTEELAIAECLASLLGTSFFIKFRLPEPTRRRRVTIVQQMLQDTRLQRELEWIAQLNDDGLDYYAYISHSDCQLLLQGVHGKIDLEDPALAVEDGRRVDWHITNAVLTRMRTVKLSSIPARMKTSIYNRDMIKENHSLYEVPMSTFLSDILDEVEVDSLGYVEVRVSAQLARGIRVDIRMDGVGNGQAGGIGLSDW